MLTTPPYGRRMAASISFKGPLFRGRSWLPTSAQWRCNLAIAMHLTLMATFMAGFGFAKQAAAERDAAVAMELRTVEVLDVTTELRVAALSAIRGERGYLLVQDTAFLAPYWEGVAKINASKPKLEQLIADYPKQAERFAHIEGRLDYHVGTMGNMIALAHSGRREEALARIASGEGRRSVDLILGELDAFEAEERRLLAERQAARERMARDAEVYEALLSIVGVGLLVAGLWSAFVMRQSLAREAAARRELERHATTDELTGLANRREALAALSRLIAGERRNGRPLSLAILDIDHFKRINDTFGHPTGDEVIRRVGQIATEIMREQDLVGRLGGEEFIVILPDTNATEAMVACDRLRAIVAQTRLSLECGQTAAVTLSAGVAQMAPGDDQGKLIAKADAALYRAKTAGRDRVLLAA